MRDKLRRRTLLTLLLALYMTQPSHADDSSRAFYQLSDRPVSALDLGFYRLDLEIHETLKPRISDLMNTRSQQISMRSYLTVGQTTDMILVIEAGLLDDSSPRTPQQARSICTKITDNMALFFLHHPLIDYFESKDPFQEKLDDDLSAKLNETLHLSAKVPTGQGLPEQRCIRPLNFI